MKCIISIIVCLFSSLFSQAQQPVVFGIKGGLNLANVQYINTDNSKARLGWNAGLLAEYNIQNNLVFRPELLYSGKGFAYSATGNGSAGSVRLNYITLPVLLGYRPTPQSAIFVGPEFGFLVKAVSKSQGISSDLTGFRRFDIGADLGASYNFSKSLGAEARYNYGFKDLVNAVYFNDNGGIAGQGKNGANRVIQLGIYYLLND